MSCRRDGTGDAILRLCPMCWRPEHGSVDCGCVSFDLPLFEWDGRALPVAYRGTFRILLDGRLLKVGNEDS